jgi:hypothetical protein
MALVSDHRDFCFPTDTFLALSQIVSMRFDSEIFNVFDRQTHCCRLEVRFGSKSVSLSTTKPSKARGVRLDRSAGALRSLGAFFARQRLFAGYSVPHDLR